MSAHVVELLHQWTPAGGSARRISADGTTIHQIVSGVTLTYCRSNTRSSSHGSTPDHGVGPASARPGRWSHLHPSPRGTRDRGIHSTPIGGHPGLRLTTSGIPRRSTVTPAASSRAGATRGDALDVGKRLVSSCSGTPSRTPGSDAATTGESSPVKTVSNSTRSSTCRATARDVACAHRQETGRCPAPVRPDKRRRPSGVNCGFRSCAASLVTCRKPVPSRFTTQTVLAVGVAVEHKRRSARNSAVRCGRLNSRRAARRVPKWATRHNAQRHVTVVRDLEPARHRVPSRALRRSRHCPHRWP